MIKSTKKAFTLVELIVVIVILAILASIAFITLQDYPKDARDSAKLSEISGIVTQVSTDNMKDPANNELIDYAIDIDDIDSEASIEAKVGDKYTANYYFVNPEKIEGDGFDDGYNMIIVTKKDDATKEICFEVGIAGENKDVIYKGTCPNDVKNDLTDGLYSNPSYNKGFAEKPTTDEDNTEATPA